MKHLIGRKLYIKWNKGMYIAIEKVPAGDKKVAELDCSSEEGLQLCNLYETDDGKIEEEILGEPLKNKSGFTIEHFFVNSDFWKTPGEYEDEVREFAKTQG